MGQGSSRPKITANDKTILQLKVQRDNLNKFTKRTHNLIENEKQEIKQLLRDKNKTRAKLLLKRIKYQEVLLEKSSDQLINLENMVSNIEFKLIEKQFVDGLKQGNDLLKKLNKEFDGVDDLLDDVQEQIEYANEIDETLSRSVVGADIDAELDRELEFMEQQEAESRVGKLPEVESRPILPEAPKGELEEPSLETERKEHALLA